MRRKATPYLAFLLAAASLVLLGATAHGQPGTAAIDSTHYWTYKLRPPLYYPVNPLARDQFTKTYIPVPLDTLERLVNWVRKNNSTVRDTFVHFTWWNTPHKFPVNLTARISNQFGSYTVTIFRLEFLLAPAWKNHTGPGLPEASHYLCYRAQGFPSPGFSYFLRDEWRNDVQFPLSLEYLCAPCWKNHAGQVYAPTDTVTHLALYPIAPTSDEFYPFIRDQFIAGNRWVKQTPREYLLVPSSKTDVATEAKGSTWGRLKVLYR